MPTLIDMRSCYDTDPKETFTVVDLCEGPGLQPYSVRFDELDVFAQCSILDEWFSTHWDDIPEIPF